MEKKRKFNLARVKCSFCNAKYVIGWENITCKYSDEFCPNCGESDFLKIIEESIEVKEDNISI